MPKAGLHREWTNDSHSEVTMNQIVLRVRMDRPVQKTKQLNKQLNRGVILFKISDHLISPRQDVLLTFCTV